MIKSQNATATIEDALSCAGDTAYVAVDVTNFIDVAAMSLFIGYDTNQAEFLSLHDINPAITGSIFANASNGEIGIAFSSINSFTINNGKLFDLKFNVLGDTSGLPFLEGTEIANSSLESIPLDTFPGSISNGIVIIEQPGNVQAYPNTDVVFSMAASGNPNYQWQENTGSGWNNLENNATYSGVNSDTLYIYNVLLSYNGNLYRCEITSGNCSGISDSALLEVALAYPSATLGYIISCPQQQILEPMYAGDFNDVIEFTFNISYNTDNLTFVELVNVHPDLLPGTLTTTPLAAPPGISIHWTHTSPVSISSGKLFDLTFDYLGLNNMLSFEPGSQALNSFSNPISLTLTNGQVVQHAVPEITGQPVNDSVYSGQAAQFMVVASGATGYQWMVSTDNGLNWEDLAEGQPYAHVQTPTLTINPANMSLNGNWYACYVSNDNCHTFSAHGILVVDTLSGQTELTDPGEFIVMPNPVQDLAFIRLKSSPDRLVINLYDMKGRLVYTLEQGEHKPGHLFELRLDAIPEGLYLAEVQGMKGSQPFRQTHKVMKIK